MNSNYIENTTSQIEKLFKDLENNVLDEYNKGSISKSEMVNIISWCEKVKEIKKNETLKDIK